MLSAFCTAQPSEHLSARVRSCGNCASQKTPRVVLLALPEGRLAIPVCPLSAKLKSTDVSATMLPAALLRHPGLRRLVLQARTYAQAAASPAPAAGPGQMSFTFASPTQVRLTAPRVVKPLTLSVGEGHLYWVSGFTPIGPREPPPQASPLDGVTRTQGSTSLCSLKLHTPPLRASPGPKAPPSGGWITYTWKPDFDNVLVSPGPQALLFLGCPRLHTLVVVTQAPSLGVVPEIHMNSRLYSRLGWCHNGPQINPFGVYMDQSFCPWGSPQVLKMLSKQESPVPRPGSLLGDCLDPDPERSPGTDPSSLSCWLPLDLIPLIVQTLARVLTA